MLDELNSKKKISSELSCKLEEKLCKKIADLSEKFSDALDKLILDVDKYKSSWSNLYKAKYCKNTLLKDMQALREYADEMELCTGKRFIECPTYEDILYSVKY